MIRWIILLQFVQSDDWLVHQRLAEALGNLPIPKTIPALKFLEKDNNHNVVEAARLSLSRLSRAKEQI